ncbi:hypothetical protein F5Y11DRAFT_363355 [Daldinia sp. FL1419]|nr:hypothetical protein F5Y11DRAFT_363355 [Daldinia sp. FL1419]
MNDYPRARRPHKKSRAGCRNYKQRRIKSAITRVSGPCEEIGESSETTAPSPELLSLKGPTSSPQLTVDELELLHHYLTDGNLSRGEKLLWQIKVPRLAFTHHYALHLVLAVSAFHLMRLEPDRSERFKRLADTHHSIGIRRATDLFPRLSTDSCSLLYVAAVLACACGFAKEPTLGNLLIIAEGHEVPWLDRLRGVRLIVENIGLEHVFSGPWALFPPPQPKEPSVMAEYQVEFVLCEGPLHELSILVSATPDSTREIYNSTFSCLSWCFHETYGTSTAPKSEIVGQFQVIIARIYKLNGCFVNCLRENTPHGLYNSSLFCYIAQFAGVLLVFRRMGKSHHPGDCSITRLII